MLFTAPGKQPKLDQHKQKRQQMHPLTCRVRGLQTQGRAGFLPPPPAAEELELAARLRWCVAFIEHESVYMSR